MEGSYSQQAVTLFGLRQKSSYALDQKPVTNNPGAAYAHDNLHTLKVGLVISSPVQ